MFKFDNPFDISKDGKNTFIDGIKYHIRQSEEYKQEIKYYIDKYVNATDDDSDLDIFEYTIKQLGIPEEELTVADEHEILDWIRTWRD